jgi:hypothetical protein
MGAHGFRGKGNLIRLVEFAVSSLLMRRASYLHFLLAPSFLLHLVPCIGPLICCRSLECGNIAFYYFLSVVSVSEYSLFVKNY